MAVDTTGDTTAVGVAYLTRPLDQVTPTCRGPTALTAAVLLVDVVVATNLC